MVVQSGLVYRQGWRCVLANPDYLKLVLKSESDCLKS